MGLRQETDIKRVEEDVISILEFCNEYSEWINNSELLHKNGNTAKIKSEGVFNSSIWILFSEYNQVYYHIYFDEVNAHSDTIDVLKCWITSLLQDGIGSDTVHGKYKIITQFINATNDFELENIDGKYGDSINTILNGMTERMKSDSVSAIRDYITFLDSYGLSSDGHFKVIHAIGNIKISHVRGQRRLPKSKDIIAFEYYIKKFFNENKYSLLVKLYKPILLWWKITNVIPMRSSEFAFKLKRDCLLVKDDKLYLKIGRVKVKSKKKKNGQIPLLNKIEITKDIFDLITEYLEDTSFDTTSKTLLSYKALKEFKAKSVVEYKDELPLRWVVNYENSMKNHYDLFNQDTLKNLLQSFYEVVIKGIYKDDTIEEQLTLGDTRHLAFSALSLQGVSPIEIAMLGGHRTLDMQVSYSGHVEYYIDSEILDYVSNRNLRNSVEDESLIRNIFNKPEVCPRMIVDCLPTEDGVGYCTLNLEEDVLICDEVHHCIFCEKWWCEPSNENYNKVKAFLEESSLGPLQETIIQEEKFLIELLSNAKTVNVDGLLELEYQYESEVKQARLKLKSDVDKLISIKKSLIDSSYNIKQI